MPHAEPIDEGLIRSLPLPLAQLCRRADNALEPFPRHQAAYYLWEAALKLLGAAVVAAYVEGGRGDARTDERLQNLARPSLGHWWELVRETLPLLAARGDGPFRRLHDALLGPPRPSMPKALALDARLRKLFNQVGPAQTNVRVRELFDRLVRYRNKEVGHGAPGMRPDDFYAEMADALLAALPELFGRLDLLAGRRLVYVGDVSRSPSGDWVVERFELVGETARRVEPMRVPEDDRDALPVPKRVFLEEPAAPAARPGDAAPAPRPKPSPLHPLVLYHESKRSVFFLDARDGSGPVEFLDYADGDRLQREDLAGALREFLAKALGAPVDPRAVERWADRARGEDGAAPAEPPPEPERPSRPAAEPAAAAGPSAIDAKIMLLYKRNAQPDERLLQALERGFASRGAEVFVDRHMAIGVEWAKELENHVRRSDFIVLLLSAASVQSEMLAYEVQLAHDEAQKRNGKPRLLPVRVNYEGPLPREVGAILDRLQYFLWRGPEDDERLLGSLLAAMGSPPPVLKSVPPPVGALPLDSEYYVVRPTDQQFESAIARRDSVVLVRGARQMGKTSLLARGLHQARDAGCRVVVTDLQRLNAADFATVDTFFRTLAQGIADALDLDGSPGDAWSAHRGPSANFERYLRRTVLAADAAPVVWAIDEVDRLFTCTFGSEVFGLFRSWHNARALDPLWSRLTLAIAYATEAHLFITDLNQSPFNIGTLLSLEDFTRDQAAWLNGRYGSPLRGENELAQFYRLVGGHPYLVNRGLYQMAQRGMGGAAFHAEAARDDGVFGDHLRRILVLLARDAELCDVIRGVLRGRGCPSPDSFYRLRSAGVLAGESAREARLRCDLYAQYLERHLL